MNFDCDEFLLFLRATIYSKTKFRVSRMVQMALFGASKRPNLISRKISMAEKLLHFHTVSTFDNHLLTFISQFLLSYFL